MAAGSLADFERLLRRAKIMEALSLAAEVFLRSTPETWEQNVLKVLEKLGEARNVQRVYACKNRTAEGKLFLFLKYEWLQHGPDQVLEEDAATLHEYAEVGLQGWAERLTRGEVICEPVKNFLPHELVWNVSTSAQGLIIVPVFVGEEWWGYLGFESAIEGEEQCSVPEVEALKAVATTFGAAIRNKRMAEELAAEKTSVALKVEERTRELKLAQAELKAALYHSKEEKARLTASIHSLSMGFVLTDREGKVELFNHAVNQILGEKLTDWTLADLIQRFEGLLDFKDLVGQAVNEMKEIRVDEVKYQEKWLRLYFTPIKMVEDDGRVIGVVCLIEDMTEAKELQRARDEFFAVASHELRTPLTAIKGNAMLIEHLMPQVRDRPEVAEALAGIETSCDRLTAMVNEYLDVSRLEMAQVTLTREPFNLVELVAGCMRGLEEQARGRGLAWELQLPDGTEIQVKGDKSRTEQVVINLLGNALKYTSQGGVYVKVTRGQETVKVAVYDTGEGIEPSEQAHLFQKFKRVGDRVYARDVKEGTGMGLYISRLLAEAMGAKVYLEKSAKGQGSGFVLELPLG